MGNIPTRVILHCSDTSDYDADHVFFDKYGLAEIRSWHRDRQFADVGYHYIVRRTGVIEKGRDESVVGAHCENHNQNSLGVCFIGRQNPTIMQLQSVEKLYLDFRSRYMIHAHQWVGHYEFNDNKVCPGLPMTLIRHWLSLVR